MSLKDGFRCAKGVMEEAITGLIHRDIGGDHQRIYRRRTEYVGVTFKHILLPVWVANYRYRDRLFQVLVNGSTGRVAGDRPWSWRKILRLGLLLFLQSFWSSFSSARRGVKARRRSTERNPKNLRE